MSELETMRYRIASAAVLVACLFGCLLGCGESKSSLHEIDHTTPAHWPVDLNDAAEKMRIRLSNLGTLDSTHNDGVSVDLKELRDLVGWIPEVAADTDLTEQQWNKVYEASEVARKQMQKASQVSPDLAQQIESLCNLLEESQKLLVVHDDKAISFSDPITK